MRSGRDHDQRKTCGHGPIGELAKKKLGLDDKEDYTLEEIYMKYFKEA